MKNLLLIMLFVFFQISSFSQVHEKKQRSQPPNSPLSSQINGPLKSAKLIEENVDFSKDIKMITNIPSSMVSGTTYFVNFAAGGINNGLSWADAFTSFQSALDIAVSGDQVWVAKGTYKPSSAYDLINTSRYYHFRMIEGVAIYGGFAGTEIAINQRSDFGMGGANETILSGDIGTPGNSDNCYHVFYHPSGTNLTGTAILDGFTVSYGYADYGNEHSWGGGMHNANSSPTISNCTFRNNVADFGGGMLNYPSASPIISNCKFTDNTAYYEGGGIGNYGNSSPTISDCTFSGNSVNSYGGGICNSYSSPNISNSLFEGNFAGEYGGGMENYPSASPIITNCTFSNNTAIEFGGGLENWENSSSIITNCVFSNNTSDYGGGVSNYDYALVTYANCTFAQNTSDYGGGIYNWGSNPSITNSILWKNSAPDGPQIYNDFSIPVVSYSDVQGGYAGTGNINANPIFVGGGTHDYLIYGISACVDAGDNGAISEAYDIRGVGYERKLNKTDGTAGSVDMGAYEYKQGIDEYTPGPVAANDYVDGWEDVTIEINVLANDTEINSDPLSVFVTTPPPSGASAIVASNKIYYRPPANFSGTDVFEYEVCDNGLPYIFCAKAKVYVTVTPVNDLPVLDNEIVVIDEDGTISGDLIDAGDSDPEGTVLQAKVEPSVAPTNGVLEVAVDGSFTYTPNANYNGADLAVVQVCDQGLPVPACVPDSIIITVNGVNDPPVVTPSSITINEDTPAVIDIAGNVTDVEGNGLVSGIISGAATFSSLFELSYVPAPNFNGTEVITYSICDDASACDTGTVTITVTPVNDPPTLISTLEDIDIMVGEKRILLLDDLLALLFNDVDVGDVLTPSVVMANGLPLPAWVTIENGTMTLQPYGGNLGCYSFLFVATDLAGATNTEAFDICVINNNIATGIDSWDGAFGVSLYPNPSSGKVVLDVEQVGFNETTVAVYNVTGQTLLNQKFSQKQIQLNLENQVSGMYYVKVTSGNNEVIKKLVLNRW